MTSNSSPLIIQQPADVELESIETQMLSNSEPSSSDRRLLLGNRTDYLRICVPLYEASIKGNWETAREIIRAHPNVLKYSITENNKTALHIASSAKGTKLMVDFVRNLVSKMNPEDLLLQNNNSNTALCLAAAGGNVSIAQIIVERNPSLLNIPNDKEMLPLYIASLYGKYDMVRYLYDKSTHMNDQVWTIGNRRAWVLLRCVEANFFDIAVEIVTHQPEVARFWGVLGALAQKTDAFREMKPHFIRRIISPILVAIHVKVGVKIESDVTHLLRIMWNYIMENLDKREIKDNIVRGTKALFIAAEMGNTKFIVELIRKYPDLIWKVNDRNQSIFHVAVLHRQEGVYNLMYEIGSMKDFITPQRDVDGNNMLHLAAKGAKKKRLQETRGVALQMQRELLWYKVVEQTLPPSCQEKKNSNDLLPHELFTIEHKDLMFASEKWMKDTASHCMVVATLIATVVFAAAFTVPGGYNNNKGIPILQDHKAFIIFVISDAISLTFATISILMFLYILTSRYAEQDFLESLPKKLMRGLAALFLSITAMMVAFSVSFFALYDKELIWVPIIITGLASIPVFLYARLQYGLLVDVYHSTYGSKNLFKPKKPMLY